ncbi:hypothetical protein NQZ68_019730 [Dissostichus eleginoides]|nr:hypothetical protein NQZ68_019730 [Dissostichus eleginoides]
MTIAGINLKFTVTGQTFYTLLPPQGLFTLQHACQFRQCPGPPREAPMGCTWCLKPSAWEQKHLQGGGGERQGWWYKVKKGKS